MGSHLTSDKDPRHWHRPSSLHRNLPKTSSLRCDGTCSTIQTSLKCIHRYDCIFIIIINSIIKFNICFFKYNWKHFWIPIIPQWNFQLVFWSRVKPAKRQQFESYVRKQAGMVRWRIWAPDLPWILVVHLPS